jgi:D-alanyl-D-alanine dipeptidase
MDSLGIAKNQDLAVEIGGNRLLVPFKNTFGDVLKGLPLAYINSRGLLSFAVNTGNFAEKYGATDDSTVKLELSSATFSDMGLLAKNNVFFDLRYATDNNFTGEKIYPSGKCYLRRNAGAALLKASEAAEKEGFALCVLDCYRPAYVQEIFWSILPDERYVANPQKGSRHGRGLAVDVSACDLSGKWLEMPTGFDDFTGKASSDAKDVSAAARKNREKLQKVMKQAGFDIFPTEWWHFDYPGWEQTPVMNFPLE